MADERLPKAQRIFDAVDRFNERVRQGVRDIPMAGWGKVFSEAREAFKEDVHDLGIAQFFDWSE